MSTLQPAPRVRNDPPRENESISDLWKRVRRQADTINALANVVAKIQETQNNAQLRINPIARIHPFQIYQLPARLRAGGPSSDGLDWLRVRVRTGGATLLSLGATPVANTNAALINCAGTDGTVNPDIETYLDNPLPSDILCNAGDAAFFIWATLTLDGGGNASLQLYYGDTPANASPTPDATWANFPQQDQYHQLIGWVDALTLQNSQQLLIRQIVRTDLMFCIC